MDANDYLKQHNCSDEFFKFNFGLIITEGTKAMADQFECYWLVDVIASFQPTLKKEPFQVWTMKKLEDGSAIVKCTDGNDRVLQRQEIPFTDFKADECTLWVEGNVILLPSEH
jgi:uncharacterized repeat protein (TIGR04076 family)